MIHPLKLSKVSEAAKEIFDDSLVKEKPAEEIFSGHETVKNRKNSSAEFGESSEDESLLQHPLVKKRKL